METRIQVFLRGRAETAETLREYARRRLSFAVGRVRHRAHLITVRLVDLNGPRKGVDSRCSMTAELVDGRSMFVQGTAASPFAAITLAAERLGHVLRRGRGRHGHGLPHIA